MSLSVEFDRRQTGRIRDRLGDGALVREPAEDLLREASEFAAREAREGARGLGGIPGSISAEVHGLEAKVSSGHAAALPMEFGRRPGATMPPPDAFARYGEEVKFVLARSVARRGIKGRFFMRNAREKLQNTELPRLIQQAAQRIAERWGAR